MQMTDISTRCPTYSNSDPTNHPYIASTSRTSASNLSLQSQFTRQRAVPIAALMTREECVPGATLEAENARQCAR
jgi:hypothetical protein